MSSLPIIDLLIIAIYVLVIVFTGIYFAFKGGGSSQFVSAGGILPAWAVGLSIFGTYLSSNTFIGVTGKAYGGNWNSFVFSLSIPIAAWIASKYFVPFYRKNGNISAYAHVEERFGSWARLYMDICYLLTQLARMASIMFGVSLVLNVLTGINISYIILAMGVLVTIYTLLGGIEAVIWTDVIQSIVLTFGAILIVIILCIDVEDGFVGIIQKGMAADKFNLGDLSFSFATPTFWVVLFYGIFINLNNFGIDQSFIQRYHTANSTSSARKSIWLTAKLYIPVSLLFFFIGTGLWVFYQESPEKLEPLIEEIASEEPLNGDRSSIVMGADHINDAEIADRVLPYFMVSRLPQGITGILIAALFAAAMSSVDSSLNSSATIIWSDFYIRYINHKPSERNSMRILKVSTIIWGILGTFFALTLIGVTSLLDTWWQLSGIFAGGMLGLFLLGFVSRSTGNITAKISVILGILVIFWMTFPSYIPEDLAYLRSPFNTNMIVVVGTLTIFLSGITINNIVRALRS